MFLVNEAALKLKNALIVADIHLGITRELALKGIYLPEQSEILAEKINRLVELTSAKKLIINGDLKHSIPTVPTREMIEVQKFIDKIEVETILVKGNHDGGIEELVEIKVKSELKLGKYTLTHGHRKVKQEKHLILAHTHPLVVLKDKYGAQYVKKVWLIDEKGDILIMPAFNDLVGGEKVNETLNLLGPIAKKLNPKELHAYLLDGTLLGTLGELNERIRNAR